MLLSSCSIPGEKPGPASLGIWFWQGNIHDEDEDSQLIQGFENGRVQIIYGAFGYSPYDFPQRMKDWNALLYANSIESQYLMAGTDWIFPENREAIYRRLELNIIEFHKKCLPEERFSAVHLDFEPHALPQWKSGDAQTRRELLRYLGETFQGVRVYLDRWSDISMPIYADLPVWFDAASDIGWENEADRDDWFSELAANLDGVSLMAYERTDRKQILADTEYERNRFTKCRIALEAELGEGKTWKNAAAFYRMIESLEKEGLSVDIHDWKSYSVLLD